jgi:hypothetical protein
MYLIGKLEQR